MLLMAVREAAGCGASPTASVIDSQSVNTTEASGPGATTPTIRSKGRKRHILTDTIGLPVEMPVHPADVQDRGGAPWLMEAVKSLYPWLTYVIADSGYARDKLKDALDVISNWTVEIVKRSNAANGFFLVPRRWAVERTHYRLAQPQPPPSKERRSDYR